MVRKDYEWYRKLFRDLSKPFAFLDLDLLQENIEAIRQKSNGKKIRIATKSLRSVPVIRYILEQGEPFQGVMCFTLPEALFLAEQGFDDLLVAYPSWDSEGIRQAACAVGSGRLITLMVDDPEQVRRIEGIAKEKGVTMPLCIDMDLTVRYPGLVFGVRRSPIRSRESLLRLATQIKNSPFVYLDGLMGYEAQIAGVGDAYPGQGPKNALVRLLKARSLQRVTRRREEAIQTIEELGLQIRFVNGGGTGSLHTTSRDKRVTEVTVGSGFYAPGLFDYYRDFRYLPAAGFVLEITRQPDPDVFTCTGGGYIASGSAGRDKLPHPYLPKGVQLINLEGAGEVQTPIHYSGPVPLKLGDPILFRHSKAGELCERFQHLYRISGDGIIDKVPTYRGNGRCFL